MKKPIRKIFTALFLTIFSSALLMGCHAKNNSTESSVASPANSTGDVREFNFEETSSSKVFLSENGNEQSDITSFVTDIVRGELYVNPEGLRYIFELGERAVAEEEASKFEQMLKDNGYTSTNGTYLCLSSSKHTLIFQEGTKLYQFDGRVRMLDAPCIKLENGTFSIPVTDLIFAFGYDSFGSSLNGNDVVFILIKNQS